VAGAIVECLAFGAFGAYNVLWDVAANGRTDGFVLLFAEAATLATLALAGGFGLSAFLLSFRELALRITGAVFHLLATVPAAWLALWLGWSELRYVTYTPDGYGAWPPWIAFAIAAALIAIGIAVLISLFLPDGPEVKPSA
jgi:hypothetical protein